METARNIPPEIQELFNKVKGRLFMPPIGQTRKSAGFLGSLLCKLSFQWTRDIKTAAISAKTLYWNPDFFMTLDKETQVTVLAHELWHNALLHGARMGDRHPEVWNWAGDYVINLLLKQHGYYMGGFPYLLDEKYDNWTTDQVYDDLMTNKVKIVKFDLGNDVLPMNGKDKDVAVGNAVAAATIARMTNQAGDLPGEFTMVINDFLHPRLPWEVILFNFFNAIVSQEYSYARPNRRYEDPLLPGNIGRNGLDHMVYMIDASASITDEQVVIANSEVKYIQEELNPERLTLIVFDTKIRSIRDFELDEPFEDIEIHGRGGTELQDCWDYIHREKPTAVIVFTDLAVDIPPDPNVPIIWINTGIKGQEVPYGRLIDLPD